MSKIMPNLFVYIPKWTVPFILILTLSNASWAAEKLTYFSGSSLLSAICEQIMGKAHERAGIGFETLPVLPGQRVLMMSNNGEVDGALCRTAGVVDKYPNLIRTGPSSISVVMNVFSKDHFFTVEGWQSLSNYKIGIRRGQFYVEEGTRGMDVFKLATDEQIIRMLMLNRIEVGVTTFKAGMKVIHELGLKGKVKALQPPLGQLPLYFHLHKKNQKYVSALSKAIEEMVEDGTTQQIIDSLMAPYE